jgi:putative redox protein
MAKSVAITTGKGFRVEARTPTHVLRFDEAEEIGGECSAPSPTETFLAALGACGAITAEMYAKRKGWPLEGVESRVVLEPAAPGEPAKIVQVVTFRGPLDDEQRARLRDIVGKCPVHKLIAGPTVLEERLG